MCIDEQLSNETIERLKAVEQESSWANDDDVLPFNYEGDAETTCEPPVLPLPPSANKDNSDLIAFIEELMTWIGECIDLGDDTHDANAILSYLMGYKRALEKK